MLIRQDKTRQFDADALMNSRSIVRKRPLKTRHNETIFPMRRSERAIKAGYQRPVPNIESSPSDD
jgi:hypothetical protein